MVPYTDVEKVANEKSRTMHDFRRVDGFTLHHVAGGLSISTQACWKRR